MSRKEGLAVAEAVHTWVNSANADEIQQEIYRWTKKVLWDWAVNEKTAKDLDKHPQQINRIVRRFVKEVLVAQNETSKPIHK